MERDRQRQAPRLEPLNRKNILANRQAINLAKDYKSLENNDELKNISKEIEDQESEIQALGLQKLKQDVKELKRLKQTQDNRIAALRGELGSQRNIIRKLTKENENLQNPVRRPHRHVSRNDQAEFLLALHLSEAEAQAQLYRNAFSQNQPNLANDEVIDISDEEQNDPYREERPLSPENSNMIQEVLADAEYICSHCLDPIQIGTIASCFANSDVYFHPHCITAYLPS